ncbi:thiamine phosphate synthase [Actinobacteria bacterium YIM 96077]|uniref:Thiamine-phosphate synthase n=1 Tax=Phytoactinopolyspora halophila TaxID=1981511 RepID=A0A329R340_9ACTN|nr:thiamine phosphate synthase [Phytoactinopolyspora halophila]AYY11635.1 thiamine phosphate synthase [Actinobacteria bacterium YIM 96077]RAW17932.1 thiamine phosphate synthase [Phytoactinopolyspora halophila]
MTTTDPVELRERLCAARLYLCTDARRDEGDLEDFLHAALGGGVDIVQLRDKTLDVRDELELQPVVARIADEHGALMAVNDRADVARLTGAAVFHTGQGDLPVAASRRLLGPDVILGRSTRTIEQAGAAEADPEVDYFCVGPVWATPTKEGRSPVGLDTIRAVAARQPSTPWFAIGGIDHENVTQVVDAGARRVVVVRAITRASDPGDAAARLRRALEI